MNIKQLISVALAFALMASVCMAFADKNISDDSIHDAVLRRLANDPVVKGGGLKIDVKQGVVTIVGTVENEKQKQRAEKLAKKVSGVKQVVNQIKLSGK